MDLSPTTFLKQINNDFNKPVSSIIITFVCMFTMFSNFYIDEVDLDFKSTSPEDEDKGSEGKKHVAMETVCLVQIYVV